MERIPLIVRRLVAAEQHCNFVHYYLSFCDLSASPQVMETSKFSDAVTADSAVEGAQPEYKLVYDVMRSRDGRILFRQLYAERFAHSLALVAPDHVFPAELLQVLQDRLQLYIDAPGVYYTGVTEQNVKIVSWLLDGAAAASPIPAILMLPKSSYPPAAMYHDGAKLGFLYDAHRANPNAKVAQTALRNRAEAFQKENGLFEVLLVHSAADGFLVPEGSRSNYLLQRRDGTWWCSAEEDIVVGITLKATYRVLEACGLGSVHHRKLNLKDVLECKSLYMLGTSPTILPVQSLLLYKSDDTRRCFDEATQALGVDLTTGLCHAIHRTDDGCRAELVIPVDAELAPRLRTQYIKEAESD
ncbi:hypothetical protein ABB37_03398 [Leptomonas pyrrhocoris]|uniref:Uncharacterized protein n=1 Tax=Leptomonas pyrrhocoris TaxID=157538 RepID=A0A0N0DWW2_LEPPY|nr:hypothetical protein ABB37_03398 [Leptomonas pyrrhocoris]XP_015660733.1 hypothetical protein ABB37_03398 [Leptomonas pyrrhocoris]XP_015660734.1 hypothetical protein ABB37_03398 [Leptomonas pyrrhocoris]XP_015660735.1 hypothetical protein ABB37_03398 [Leptomonas pyrrhocoris]KPA82293.1 hypothetical protein ABB37_03398 [Leptomonas pyrrhocoris]KPA82294.1 hypothetical protein ABB37_03398 [Leptomonas pyrrhocoris]KPA82295.1 hypothetical protein ABB37_03398 [Leptomonas pyrrhocoris]KPA82296.1 hypot|eukprot:XP_015660732.1 hypothetical protein ABB37_03398 [Leptomonas pyrrhocoris]